MENRKFWGWGYTHFDIDQQALEQYKSILKMALGIKEFENASPPRLEDLNLREPRFSLPDRFKEICSATTFDRAAHSYGKSFRDIWRGLHGQFDNPPDYIAYPKTEEEIQDLMAFAGENKIALIPFGGGSSVAGGVEPDESSQKGVITIDLKYFDKILEIDYESRAAKIQGGIFGPALEAGLKPLGLTLRHYPQSFEFSTLGGWIATRSGGHFATLFTHIDEFVQGVRMVTPNGILESRRLPGHGAGPSEERLVAGSEGTFGIITEAWMRLQTIPKFKATQAVNFPTFMQGVNAAKALSQSGLNPSNARLIDSMEALSNGLGNGQNTVLIVGFESHNHEVNHLMDLALSVCKKEGGTWIAKPQKEAVPKDDAAAERWKKSFLQGPYLRDELLKLGLIVETFETATTWDNFEKFNKAIRNAVQSAIKEHCGIGTLTCRFTHLYPDGPAPYYTVIAKGKAEQQLNQWQFIKEAASQAIIDNGGTITHHHAVGRDHAKWYKQQRSVVFGNILKSVKKDLDPKGVMNPGILGI